MAFAAVQRPSPADKGRLRILIIEDSASDLRLIQETLTDALPYSLSFQTSDQLTTALESFQWFDFDIVFLDLNLPDASWLDTLQSIQQHGDQAPIIVMSGLSDEDISQQAIRAGAQDYLVKGQYDPENLERTVRDAVERHQLLLNLKEAREREWRRANIDAVTELPNRRSFEDSLGQTIARAHRNGETFALLLIGLEYSRPSEAAEDFDCPDPLLAEAALRLRDLVRESDLIARLDDDEFVVLTHDLNQADNITLVAEKAIRTLTAPYTIGGQEFSAGVSIGIAIYPLDSAQGTELIQFADLAMYRAKDDGGDSYHFYSRRLEQEASQRLSLENNLRQAITANELVLHYQPSIDLASGRVVSMEALLRWQHRRHGLLLPQAFVPLAEASNLILALDFWALERACRQNLRWQQQGYFVRVAVNMSARHFRRPEQLVEQVAAVLTRTGLAGRWLELEVTETALVQQTQQAADAIRQLQALGVHVTLDDFGVGYSTLSYLRDLPVNTIKIDRSFLADIPSDLKNAALLNAILALAGTLNLRVVAEGVEHLEQVRWLQRSACDSAQGYFFAYPEPAPNFTAACAVTPAAVH